LGFNSRRNATSRVYQFNILNRAWPSPLSSHTHFWVRDELDAARMAESAQGLVGVHDFRPLATGHPRDKSAVRRVDRWEVRRDGATLVIECEASGFLRHQIRKANALLVGVGKSRYPVTITSEVLKSNSGLGAEVPVLPAHGLCLVEVKYSVDSKSPPGCK
jgi:tRNA pseudouridine38-40 synthase